MEHCVQKEFENYWNLLTENEKDEFRNNGIESYKQRFALQMVDARATYNGLLSNELLYTEHASQLTELDFLVNRVLMKKEHLPDKNSLDGLLMLRAAWDIVDIALDQLKFFKRMAKFCFAFLLLLGVLIVVITVQTADIDKILLLSIPATGTELKGAQFLTFLLSLVSSFMAAVQAFYNPVRRWQQVRDAAESMQSESSKSPRPLLARAGPVQPPTLKDTRPRPCACSFSFSFRNTRLHQQFRVQFPRLIFHCI